ncbi:MAG: PEGA domain-containing protein, partial [Polyangia bacterium]
MPPALEKIVLHALAKKPEFRFASMDEFRSALRDPERFSQTLDGQGGIKLTPDGGIPAVNLPGTAGMGPPPAAPPPPSGRFPQQSPRTSNEAPTMMAQAPDPAAIAKAQAEAQKARHEATTAPTARRPDPERIVSQRPAKNTVAQPVRGRKKSRAPMWSAAVAVLAVVGGGAGWYFIAGPGRGGHVAVTVTTDPAGADVYDGDKLVGPAPTVVKVPRDGEPHTIAVKKDGYLTAQRVVTGKENQALKLRLTPKPPQEEDETTTP